MAPKSNYSDAEITSAESWAYTDQRLTLGYIGPDGKRVPGFLEQIAVQGELLTRSRIIDSWILRFLLIFTLVRFLGFDHLSDILKFVHH